MVTQPVTTTNTTSAAASSTTGTTGSTNTLSQNDFLQLLMTQLQNQDPLSPTDTNQFVSEMCQLTSTQAITNMQTDMDNLAASMQQGNMGQWASAIGDYMQVNSTSISTGDEVVLNPTGSYDSLTLTLKDSSGNESTQTFTSGQSPVYDDTSGNYTIVGAMATTNGVSSTCNYSVYRQIAGVQPGTSGTSLLASDGTAYPTSTVTQIIK
jgi:flagellar basal-body rod modification protein FlgD